jgi:WD40 repeat protein
MLPLGFTPTGTLLAFTKNAVLTGVDPDTLRPVSALGVTPAISTQTVFWVTSGNLSGDGRIAGLQHWAPDTVDLLDLHERRYLCSISNLFGKVCFAAKQQWVATATGDRTVTIWQLPRGTVKWVLTNAVIPLQFSRDERMLATSANNPGANVTVWDLQINSPRPLVSIPIETSQGALSPDRKILVTGDETGFGGKVWALPSGRNLAIFPDTLGKSVTLLLLRTAGPWLLSPTTVRCDSGTWPPAASCSTWRFP